MLSSIDQQSLENAKNFLSNPDGDSLEIGTTASLQQIHHALFDGLYDFSEAKVFKGLETSYYYETI